jgi:hypothetical protein
MDRERDWWIHYSTTSFPENGKKTEREPAYQYIDMNDNPLNAFQFPMQKKWRRKTSVIRKNYLPETSFKKQLHSFLEEQTIVLSLSH